MTEDLTDLALTELIKENNDEENTVAVVNILGPIIDGYQASGAASGDNISALFDKALKNDQNFMRAIELANFAKASGIEHSKLPKLKEHLEKETLQLRKRWSAMSVVKSLP